MKKKTIIRITDTFRLESLAKKDFNTQIFGTRISVNSSLNRRYLVYSSFSLPSQTSL